MDSIPRSRVELHVHVDGAVQPSTIWELSKQKGLSLPGDGSLEALKAALTVTTPTTLCDFLSRFKWITPAIKGDLNAIERIAYELCEEKAKQGVFYLEMRGCPHLLTSEDGSITAKDVMRSYLKGVQRGEKDFNIKSRFIICCMRFMPEYAMEIVEMADEFRNSGVVGIDIAGDEAKDVDDHGEEHFNELIIAAFQEARRRNIHRTVHAGEAGPANGVLKGMELLDGERIGHGYRVLEDATVYKKVLDAKVHLETCPVSSILTSAVVPGFIKHPIVQFAEDNANFSISTDDPTVTDSTLSDEYKYLYKLGLTEVHIVRANINAIRAAFLPEEEKKELISKLTELLSI